MRTTNTFLGTFSLMWEATTQALTKLPMIISLALSALAIPGIPAQKNNKLSFKLLDKLLEYAI
jgi:hypothetical protein